MKQYTRKQIREAIEYWESVLEDMNKTEVGRNLLNDFRKIYSNKQLCSKKLDFIPTQHDAVQMYEILNKHVFSGLLKTQEVLLLSETQMASLYKRLNFNGSPADYYAQYFPILKPSPDGNGMPVVNNDIFVFNMSNCPVTVSFMISSICHEMIHKFDMHSGTLRKAMKDYFEKHIPYEEHATPIWIEKSDLANSCGLTVIPNGNGLALQKLCELSAVRIERCCADDDISKLDEGLRSGTLSGESTAKAWKLGDGTWCVAFG